MFRIKRLVMFTLAGFAVLQACNNDKIGQEQTTESGLKYTFLRRGEATQEPDSGKLMVFNMVYTTENDSVIFDTRTQNMPVAIPVRDTTMQGMLAEGFEMLRKGDSARFVVPAENFFNKTARMPVPSFVKKESNIIFRVGVEDVVTEEAYRERQMEQYQQQQEQAMKDMEVQLGKDVETIGAYLQENNINAQKTESGLHYVVQEQGKGPEVDEGDEVSVHYRGKLLDGTPFDASYDRGEPLSFNVGQGRVIPGWDEGLQQLRKGSKATFYIPSPLGYGPRGAGPVIKPNSILVFDVEVVDVTKQ